MWKRWEDAVHHPAQRVSCTLSQCIAVNRCVGELTTNLVPKRYFDLTWFEWLNLLLQKFICIMSFFFSPLHSAQPFWSHVLHMSSTSCHGSCLFLISKTFFSSHVIVPYCWHLSSKLATCRVWNSSTFYIPTLKIFYWLPIDKRSLANQCRCFLAAVNF